MNNQLYNYIFGSLVGLIDQEQREEITKQIFEQTQKLKSVYDIEMIKMSEHVDTIIKHAIVFDLVKESGKPIEEVLNNLQYNADYRNKIEKTIKETKDNYYKMIASYTNKEKEE